MSQKMLIDAHRPEETRVAVLNGQTIDHFDVEHADKSSIKGNIYLAKVDHVEPSLQAAFVEYGGGRHGFLAFSEIHPDYYRLPAEDKAALLDQSHEEDEKDSHDDGKEAADKADKSEKTDDFDEDNPAKSFQSKARKYRIQEVIKKNQVILVQAVREERGNKCAAFTTYISLAGRYCVLMPNTSRGACVSRKITDAKMRERFKTILSEFDVPADMAVIARTAGSGRRKSEIKRDYDYLQELWSDIRKLTIESVAPLCVYQEGNIIIRSLRDIYKGDITEVLIQGEAAHKQARSFIRQVMPSHVKRIKLCDDDQPLFYKYRIDDYLDQMHEPVVTLSSGGYIVINPTEALVSIDVNSGKSTQDRHVKATALRTNMEAAEVIARQLRLRDLGGIVVVDFIDMDDMRHRTSVENALKDALQVDRARTQVGRIDQFGLLAMSRQRLRHSVLESVGQVCGHCQGSGMVRSINSSVNALLRQLESYALKGQITELVVQAQPDLMAFLLNEKRTFLTALEEKYDLKITVELDMHLGSDAYQVTPQKKQAASRSVKKMGDQKPSRSDTRKDGGRRRPRQDNHSKGNALSEETRKNPEAAADQLPTASSSQSSAESLPKDETQISPNSSENRRRRSSRRVPRKGEKTPEKKRAETADQASHATKPAEEAKDNKAKSGDAKGLDASSSGRQKPRRARRVQSGDDKVEAPKTSALVSPQGLGGHRFHDDKSLSAVVSTENNSSSAKVDKTEKTASPRLPRRRRPVKRADKAAVQKSSNTVKETSSLKETSSPSNSSSSQTVEPKKPAPNKKASDHQSASSDTKPSRGKTGPKTASKDQSKSTSKASEPKVTDNAPVQKVSSSESHDVKSDKNAKTKKGWWHKIGL
jgi:ribonuclease E